MPAALARALREPHGVARASTTFTERAMGGSSIVRQMAVDAAGQDHLRVEAVRG